MLLDRLRDEFCVDATNRRIEDFFLDSRVDLDLHRDLLSQALAGIPLLGDRAFVLLEELAYLAMIFPQQVGSAITRDLSAQRTLHVHFVRLTQSSRMGCNRGLHGACHRTIPFIRNAMTGT